MDKHNWIIDIHVRKWISIISITDNLWIALIRERMSIKGLSFLPFHRFGCLNVLGANSSDDFIPWWRHQMGTSSKLLALCAGNSLVTGEFPSQRPATWSFDVSLIRSVTEQMFKQTIKTPVIWDAIALIMTSLWCAFPAWFHFVVFHFLVIRTNFVHALTAYIGLVSYLSCAKTVAT